jgi:hypothetical protein
MKENPRNFKVGDFVYYEFKLCEVKDIKDTGSADVSDGYFIMGNVDLKDCFPVSLDIKTYSECFEVIKQKLNDLKFSSLNYPDCCCYLENMWKLGCDSILSGNEKMAKWANKECDELLIQTTEYVAEQRKKYIKDVRICK